MVQDPLIGTHLGHFKIERIIAAGGMGVIYQAVHSVIGRKAAIKVLSKKYSNDRKMIKRFHLEARAVNQIGHPNIIDIFDFGQTPDNREYFIMEYLPGQSLGQLLEKRGPLPWSLIAPIMTQLLDALGAAHEQQIVHRDIKPENILVTEKNGEFVAKILDFGIAKSIGLDSPEGERLTRAGVVLGTPEYISPEQIRGIDVDGRADLYSMGVILFEMVMGQRPFNADSMISILMAHLKSPVPKMKGIPAHLEIPVFVPSVICRAMAKDPEQRFSDSATFARALNLETSAVEPTDGTRPLPQMMWESKDVKELSGKSPFPPRTVYEGTGGTIPFPGMLPGGATTSGIQAPLPQGTTIPGTASPTKLLAKKRSASRIYLWLIPIAFACAGIVLFFTLREPSKPAVAKKNSKKVSDASASKSKKPELDLQALYDKVRRVLRSGSNFNKSNIRRICIRGIGKLRDDDAFALLTATLKDDPDRTVRSAAAMAIAEAGLPEGVQALEQARERSAEVMKVWIDEALMRLGQAEGKTGLSDALQSTNMAAQFQAALALGEAGEKAAAKVLKEVARKATLDRTMLIAILGTLANLGHKESTKALEKALDQSDKVVKLGAAEALAKLGHEKALATLKTLLADEDITSQLVAGKVLASLGDFSGLELLRKNVTAKEVNIRQLAAEGLGSISDKVALSPLASALEDTEWAVKATAAESLAKLFALMPSALIRRSQDWVKTALAARDWSVRHAAVGVSSEMDPELAVNLLGWAFKDKDPRIRAAAVDSMARLRSHKVIPLLERALADPVEDVREKAAQALGKLKAVSATKALHKTVRDKSPRVGMAAAGSLLAMGDTSYIKDLYNAARDKNPELRRSAMMALGKWRSPQSDKKLKDALSDKSPRVRFAAAYQLAKRGNKDGAAELWKTVKRGGRDGERAIEVLSALGLKPQKEISGMAHSRSSKDRKMAMANAYRLSPPVAIKVLRQGVRAPEKSVRLAAARSLSRMAKKSKHTIPLLRRLSHDPSPAVRAQANIGLARAKKAHSKELSKLDRGKVKPVKQAPLPLVEKPKPKPPVPKGKVGKKRRPLFARVDSPQQLYMYNLSRATVATSRGQFKAALRYLNKAFRQKKNNVVVLCEYGYVFHQRALSMLRRGAAQKARSDLIIAQKYYRQCHTRARQPLVRKKAQRGLRDIVRTLQQTR